MLSTMASTGAGRDARWQFWIDRGGTFTDVVARSPEGRLQVAKLLSEDPEHYDDAAVEAIRRILGVTAGEPVPADRIGEVRMGTTVATNALLERAGARTVLVVTGGFRDLLRIGHQARPRLFDRHIVLPELLAEATIEADERLAADGSVIVALDLDRLRADLTAARASGIESCAIVFLHGYRHTAHEQAAADLARELGFEQVSVSHEVNPMLKAVPRGDTTVVDAYLSPILRRYVARVRDALGGAPLAFMQSSGGLAEAAHFTGKDAVLSGPAGGIVGMVRVAAVAGVGKVIGFDMGGTSTDVSHYAGELERTLDTEVAGVRLRAPMLHIHTVAAGGGSIVHFDGARLRVGPASAGANPGPACYRRGGPLTVTDANVVLGRIDAASFPATFGPDADQPLDADAAHRGFTELATAMSAAAGRTITAEEAAAGALRIAVANMANAIKKISVARGYDVTEYTLVCFGGAGGQAACAVADELGMTRVLVHPYAGVLSAYGMGLADHLVVRETTVEAPLDDDGMAMALMSMDQLATESAMELLSQGVPPSAVSVVRRVHLRYAGTDTPIGVPWADRATVLAAFEAAHLRRYAFLSQRSVVIDAVSVEASGGGTAVEAGDGAAWGVVRRCEGQELPTGAIVDGPAVITEDHATTVVDPGWRATLGADGALVLERVVPRDAGTAPGTEVDPVLLEVFNNLFMSIAEQMGLRLQQTAASVNIKERLDFSCALFDPEGRLIANAPHMPVHLGSMSESIRTVIDANRQTMRPGDSYVLNDPYHGGTHLPDVTVITPVYVSPTDAGPTFFVASRGHHADIGGITPGSMPPRSVTITDEGVLLDNVLAVRDGVFREDTLRAALLGAPHPARNVEENLGDVRAQLAANQKGVEELLALVERVGVDVVLAYMGHVRANAAESVRRAISALHDGSFTLTLDGGAQICVRVTVDRVDRSAVIDFTGTSPQQPDNFNAPRAITTAAVLYVFRTLVDDDIPLNGGCLEPLHIVVPEGSMLNPAPPAAVVAGNVEVSMCVTSAIYGALGVLAGSQPTMNNVTFGNERVQYYETLSGGSGAGPDFDGTSVVQTHMTNSRLTDPEVLELRFPVRIDEHRIRPGSGGAGRHRGGDGAVRRIRFLEPMVASVLSNGREHPAFGLAGGEAGAPGRNWIERTDGTVETFGARFSAPVGVDDVLVVETPGGGGFGSEG